MGVDATDKVKMTEREAFAFTIRLFQELQEKYDRVIVERNAHAAYVNKLLGKILELEKECGREPGDY